MGDKARAAPKEQLTILIVLCILREKNQKIRLVSKMVSVFFVSLHSIIP
mgnify:CR=1 FL=1